MDKNVEKLRKNHQKCREPGKTVKMSKTGKKPSKKSKFVKKVENLKNHQICQKTGKKPSKISKNSLKC